MSACGSVGGVSVRGLSHIGANLPNQDALSHWQEGGWTFLAVADGHGAARHYRSDRGAVFAVETAVTLLRSMAAGGSPDGVMRSLPTLADQLVAGWRARVEADIRVSPLKEPPGFESHAVYGSTCVAAGIGPGMALFFQIGDGDVLAAAPAVELDRAIPLDPHLVGPGTYSLCQTDAVERVRVRLFTSPHPLSTPDFVMVATDGLSKSYQKDQEFVAVSRHVRQMVQAGVMTKVLAELEPWLVECSRRGSRDDMTIAMFSGDPGTDPR